MLKDLKFQLALAVLIATAVHYFVPDINVDALVDTLAAVIAVILGGHSVANYIKG